MLTKKWILSDTVSKSHSQCLKAALYSYFNVQRPLQNTLPAGYHLIYFNPKHEEEALSKDGYDAHQQPEDSEFTRRLWIGGQMKFHKPVPFDEHAFCLETIDKFRKMKDNTYVTINREIISGGDVAIEEQRTLIYTKENYTPLRPTVLEKKAEYTHVMKPSELLLFRYSALTFNSHKIHHNKEYAMSEGYPGVLMHGPLSVTLLLEWLSTLYEGANVKEFKYKNSMPVFAGDEIHLCLKETDRGIDLWIQKKNGELCVDGSVVF